MREVIIEDFIDELQRDFENGSLSEYEFCSLLDINPDYISHEGKAHDENPPGRGSGRYAWGSGEHPNQRVPFANTFIKNMKNEGCTDKDIVKGLKDLGFSDYEIARNLKRSGYKETEIADAFEISTTALRARIAIDKTEQRRQDRATALALHDQGYSYSEIGRRMGRNESSIRSLLNDDLSERNDALRSKADELKQLVADKKYIDIGPGSELYLGITKTKLNTAVAMLEQEGYKKMTVYVDQMGTNNKTAISVLAPPGTTYKELYNHLTDIKTIQEYHGDVPENYTNFGIERPKSISMDRVMVRWSDEGGDEQDGIIELRRGVEDISLGGSLYSQVRIGVNDKYYLKGMARYSDGSDMPDGIDIIFNTNKAKVNPLTGEILNKEDAMKPMKINKKTGEIDWDNPFGAAIMTEDGVVTGQRHYIDEHGNEQLSVINKVNDEGSWGKWSKNLASQMLSKQPPQLAKKQLDLAYADAVDEFEEIKALNNPTVKRKLLESFADDCDASAVHLKAAALPRQASHVLLPVPGMKEDEIYAPNYENGEKVVLIRYPHGSKAEIPTLTVNNNQKTANSFMHNAPDAVGINYKVAQRLSGADFDGDTVLVIPIISSNGTRIANVKTSPPLEGLADFDPKIYKLPDSAPYIKSQTKQTEMGKVSNLITDMTIMGADDKEIARAIRHSMVVIDSEKHHLDYKLSEKNEGIDELKRTYQNKGDRYGGASTLISRASGEVRVSKRKEAYKPDDETGERIFYDTPEYYEKKVPTRRGEGGYTTRTVERTITSTQMAETKDARTLMSGPNHEGTPIERVYAQYANDKKALANEARKEMLKTGTLKYNPEAKKKYADEVKSLDAKVNIALSNAPRERQAQIYANEIAKAKFKDNPDLTSEDKKKIKGQALAAARTKTGAKKDRVNITDREWEAIQAGAITDSKLQAILNNADLDVVKQYATPRQTLELSDAKKARIKALQNSGYSTDEIAKAVGVSTTTVNKYAS